MRISSCTSTKRAVSYLQNCHTSCERITTSLAQPFHRPISSFVSTNTDRGFDNMAQNRASSQGNARGKQFGQRTTHFLCFPLTTPTSIPQLAKSLAHFRDVTTKPSRDSQTVSSSTNSGNLAVSQTDADAEDEKAQHGDAGSDKLRLILPKAHRPPGTYHLTLGVMDLSDPAEMQRALELLESLDYRAMLSAADHPPVPQPRGRNANGEPDDSLKASAQTTAKLSSLSRPISPPVPDEEPAEGTGTVPGAEPEPLAISLTGLDAFNSPKHARVFYAKPQDPTKRLYNFGLAIRQHFRAAGFITETRPLVLHATVANLRYVTQAQKGRTSKGKKWSRGGQRWKDSEIDASEIVTLFDKYGGVVDSLPLDASQPEVSGEEYIWAREIAVDRIAICKLGAEKSDDEVLGLVYPPIGEKLFFADSK